MPRLRAADQGATGRALAGVLQALSEPAVRATIATVSNFLMECLRSLLSRVSLAVVAGHVKGVAVPDPPPDAPPPWRDLQPFRELPGTGSAVTAGQQLEQQARSLRLAAFWPARPRGRRPAVDVEMGMRDAFAHEPLQEHGGHHRTRHAAGAGTREVRNARVQHPCVGGPQGQAPDRIGDRIARRRDLAREGFVVGV